MVLSRCDGVDPNDRQPEAIPSEEDIGFEQVAENNPPPPEPVDSPDMSEFTHVDPSGNVLPNTPKIHQEDLPPGEDEPNVLLTGSHQDSEPVASSSKEYGNGYKLDFQVGGIIY